MNAFTQLATNAAATNAAMPVQYFVATAEKPTEPIGDIDPDWEIAVEEFAEWLHYARGNSQRFYDDKPVAIVWEQHCDGMLVDVTEKARQQYIAEKQDSIEEDPAGWCAVITEAEFRHIEQASANAFDWSEHALTMGDVV